MRPLLPLPLGGRAGLVGGRGGSGGAAAVARLLLVVEEGPGGAAGVGRGRVGGGLLRHQGYLVLGVEHVVRRRARLH